MASISNSFKSFYKKYFLLLIIFFSSSVSFFLYAQSNNQTLKVGYIDYQGFIEKQDDGTYIGYGVEYLNRISIYTGFNYEYVYGEWADLLNKLQKGEIDILCHAQYTDERAKIFEYSVYPIGYTQGLLYTRKNNEALSFLDYSTFDNLSIGGLRGSAMTPLFYKFAEQRGFSFNLIEYDTDELSYEALIKGEIDALCNEHLANHPNLSLLASFGADAYYIISRKNNSFMKNINFALQEIKTDVDFETNLYHKYYDNNSTESNIPFLQEEKKFIKENKHIVVGVMQGRSPLSYKDKHNQAAGIIIDYMNLISQKCGIEFEYKFLDVGERGYDFLVNSKGDLVAGISCSDFSLINPLLLQSNNILMSNVVFVGHEGMEFKANSNLTVALPLGFINGERVIKKLYPSFSFCKYSSNEDCLKAIRNGKADVMLQNMFVIRECLQSSLYDKLVIFPAYSFPEAQKVVSLPSKKNLLSIINKSINSLTEEQINDIVIKNTISKVYHAHISELIYKYRYSLLGILLLFFSIISLLIVFYLIRRKNFQVIESINMKLEQTNNKLRDAVRQADRASTAKSQFLSQMSHEIRTPMNAIVGLTEIAKQYENDSVKIDGYLNKISTSSRVLLNIINDILDMSAIESGKLKIINERFDIKQIINEISTIYYPQCLNKGIVFEIVINVENEILIGDSLRVNQILLNLVSNAYKFTDKGGMIRILIEETCLLKNTTFLCFTVMDTGCGMNDDMKNRLFKPFEQENSTTAKKHGGSGLGLSIAKNLIDMMHGVIHVESEQGKGTTFKVNLPFEIDDKHSIQKIKELNSINVIVVDDDDTSLKYTETVIKRIGVNYKISHSGNEALLMIDKAQEEKKPFNIALIDWKMPGMDGLNVTKLIREKERNRTLIIIASAYDLNEVEDQAKKVGADYFITKPLFQSNLFNLFMNITDGKFGKKESVKINYNFLGHKILLAEDLEINAEIATEFLNLVNMEVDKVENGKQALQLFESTPIGTYDAILMDVQMPEMDGYEATRAIRALSREDAKTIPIIAMTANAFTEDISAAISSGMNGHIAKPIDTTILYETLNRITNQNKGK